MVATRAAAAAQRSLFEALLQGDAERALLACNVVSQGLHTLVDFRCLTSVHLAAAVDYHRVLAALLAAGAPLDSPLVLASAAGRPDWVQQLVDSLSQAQTAALVAGCTPLAVACRLGHVDSVQCLLELGADPNAVGPAAPAGLGSKPFTPLSAAVLTASSDPRFASIAQLLLQHGADPLAPSVQRRCTTLRCACGSEFLPNGTLSLMLDHLEQQRQAGQLQLTSMAPAVELMGAAARCRRMQLFQHAHAAVVAAGWQPGSEALGDVLRCGSLGGSVEILRCMLDSPLGFSLPEADAFRSGLLSYCALKSGNPEALQLLSQAGAQLTLQRLLYSLEKAIQPPALAALLACQTPPMATTVAFAIVARYNGFTCPIHRVLWMHHRLAGLPKAAPANWHRHAVQTLEVLLAAGYRPTVYTGLQQAEDAPQAVLDPFDLFEVNADEDSRLVLVAKQQRWEPTSHRIWPDSFKAAVRTLLLAANRLGGSSSARGAACARPARRGRKAACPGLAADTTLAALPADLLLHIVEKAAFPVSAWL